MPTWNTLTVAVRAGDLAIGADGVATLDVPLTAEANVALDPRLLLGPQLAPAAAMPSGIVAAIMTDVFLRQATVLPGLPAATALPQRLAAVAQAAVAQFDRDGDGVIAVAEAAVVPGAFLAPADFTRVAITVEPAVRTTPLLLPSDQAVVLVGLDRGPAAVC